MHDVIEFSPSFSVLTVHLDQGESVCAEPGAMIAQSGVSMETGMSSGGFLGSLKKRLVAGESFFLNTFTGDAGGGWVSLAAGAPGDIVKFEMSPWCRPMVIQSSSYLASAGGVEVDTQFQGLFGALSGEGLFFLLASPGDQSGVVYCNAYGAIKEYEVRPGQELSVDTGHMVCFTEGLDYSIGKVGGIKSMLLGGEGLVMQFRGTGSVWVQTRSLDTFADALSAFLPSR